MSDLHLLVIKYCFQLWSSNFSTQTWPLNGIYQERRPIQTPRKCKHVYFMYFSIIKRWLDKTKKCLWRFQWGFGTSTKIKKLKYVNLWKNYLKSNIYIHAKLPGEAAKTDGQKLNKGRPKVITIRHKHKIKTNMLMLRETLGSFSIKRLKLESGVDPHVSDNTIIHILKHNKYHYLQSWKKGLMSRHDTRRQLLFAQRVNSILSRDFWTNGIGFYFDGA